MLELFKNHISLYIDDTASFMDALAARKKRAFRLTSSRKVPYINELGELFRYEPVKNIDSTYSITDEYDNAAETVTFQTGGMYLLNPSSVLPAQILTSYMPDEPLILDMAAAPGGKTCAVSDMLGRRGLIAANEPSKARLKSLNFNLERCGAWNVKTLNYDGRQLSKYYSGVFDGVLLDAPCSHENQIAINKKILAQWSPGYAKQMAALQKELILSAFDCLKPGGTLVYSTCTFSVVENEEVVRHLLNNKNNAELITIDHPYSRGISGDNAIDSAVLRVFPHLTEMDGFFTAAIRCKGELAPGKTMSAHTTGEERTFIENYFIDFPRSFRLNTVNTVVYMEAAHPLKGNFFRTGMVFGRKFGKKNIKLELSSQSLWEFGAAVHRPFRLDVDDKIAANYMKGFDTPVTNTYHDTIIHGESDNAGLAFFYYRDIPVGVNKIVDTTYKNKLDRYFLYGKTINW